VLYCTEQHIATKLTDAVEDAVVPVLSFVVAEDALEVASVVGSATVTSNFNGTVYTVNH